MVSWNVTEPGIGNDEQLQRILVNNTPYLTIRTDQVLGSMWAVPRATSLWFALFAEVAFSDEEMVKAAWNTIFRKPSAARYYDYYRHINELRRHRLLSPYLSWEYNEQTEFGSIRLFKPDDYEYGAWRVVDIVITLTPDSAAGITDIEASSGLSFPEPPQRLFSALPEQGYSYPVPRHLGTPEIIPGQATKCGLYFAVK